MIGERLLKIRKDNGDTQETLAKRMGVSLRLSEHGSKMKTHPAMR